MSIKLKNFDSFILIISIIGLSFAYYVEYIMALVACPLCIYQRFPYLIFIGLSIYNLASGRSSRFLYIITIIGAIFLAAYHSGVERQIFAMSSFCKPLVEIGSNMSADDFRSMLYSQGLGMCNKPALVIFKLSMAEWNLLLNIFLFIIVLIALISNKSKMGERK